MQTLERQLDKLEASPPIKVDTFSFNQPELIRKELGPVFNYFCRVESEVSMNTAQIRYLFPEIDPASSRFLDIWLGQELAHGRIFASSLEALELEQPEVSDNGINLKLSLGRRLSQIPRFAPVLMMNYLARGAMHERLTASGYRIMREILLNHGEHDFVSVYINKIEQQEAGHLGYYTRSVKDLRAKLAPWQMWTARRLTEISYQPVGVGSREQLADFGAVALALVGIETKAFADPVQSLAQQLLGDQEQGIKLPNFVNKKLQEAVEEHAGR